MKKEETEQTLVLIKPDALKNSLTGYVLSQLSEVHTGLRFAAAKIVHVSRMLAEEHYAEHRGKIFFPSLIEYIMGLIHYPEDPARRRVIALVYQGQGAVKKIRDICGPTNPHVAREKKPGCVRALGTVVPLRDAEGKEIGERMDNLIHASASDDEAEREIKLWFEPGDFPPFMRSYPTVVNREEHYYFKGAKLYVKHERDSVCLIAPGDVVWKSDFEALGLLHQGLPAHCSLESVAAKYLINYTIEK
ncbi:MAG TPA: nucleoside-diphosphate kinase [Thermodesulfovibrionales bacterium]|nr:nucleoside-diphosphate kinase [Thermodesulfovibrionales bacterium]